MKYKENRDSVEFDRLHEKDYSDKLIHGYSTLTEFEKAFIGERNMVMAFGIPIKPKRNLNKVGRSEDQSHYDYIGAPGSEEWPIPNTWEVDAGVYGTIRGIDCQADKKIISQVEENFHKQANIELEKYYVGNTFNAQAAIQDGVPTRVAIRHMLDNKDYSKLYNVNINKGQGDMFSYTNNNPAADDITGDEFIMAHMELVNREKAKRLDNYRPLPESVTIKKSFIDGLGLFAKQNLDKDVVLGISHHYVENGLISELIRTPLAAFCNHSTNPNCKIEPCEDGAGNGWEYKNFKLVTIKPIPKGTEMTVDYRHNLIGYANYSSADFLADDLLEDRVYENSVGTKYYYNPTFGSMK